MHAHPAVRYRNELIFIGICFAVYWAWACTIPFNSAPDEQMKWDLIHYIFKTGTYPPGYEPSLIDADYGRSYAFEPALAYLADALLVRLWSFFSPNAGGYYMAARLLSVFISCGTVFVLFRIGGRLFNDKTKWLFACGVALLPQYTFLSSYINVDIFAVFCCSVIAYYWIRALESRWAWRDCLGLGLGIGLCLLSYYFAYPIIVASLFVFGCSAIAWRKNRPPLTQSRYVVKALAVAGIAALVAGWYFVRNAVLYNGDIFTRDASRSLSEIHAALSLRPSLRMTPEHMHVSLGYMLTQMKWVTSSARSFFGVFDYMAVFLPVWVYWLMAGVLGFFAVAGLRVKKWLAGELKWKIFAAGLALALAGNLFIDLYYSYYEDFQAQGRYLMEGMLIPLFLLVSIGADKVNGKLFRNSKFSVQYVLIGLMALVNLYAYRFIFLTYR